MPTLEERKEKLEMQIAQKKARLNKLNQQLRTQERKERTRRLIQHGALAEKYLRCPDVATEDFEKLLAQIVAIPQVKELLKKTEYGSISEGLNDLMEYANGDTSKGHSRVRETTIPASDQEPTENKTKSGNIVTDATLEALDSVDTSQVRIFAHNAMHLI